MVEYLEWIYIGTLSIGSLSVIGLCYFIFRLISLRKNLKTLDKSKPKGKKAKRNKKRQKIALSRKKQSILILFIVSLVSSLIFFGSSAYIRYYQAMNLTPEDSKSIVTSYYLIRDFEDQLNLLKDKKDDQTKLEQNIRQLSTSMASYGTKKANTLNSVDGQLVLNRYYNSVKQLGMNASTQTKNFYGNSELVNQFLKDIQGAKDYEGDVFKYYKVDKAVLIKGK
ncbi:MULTISPECIES: hypothetical protein [unclassified Vagococcus]|uniref:hypothetical protein n=1 Tax=unclassified Vagococcus TaxID=2648499 RepID=UPI001F5048B6|nr:MULTISPECIES: hypothetical protein [unclassified Vagococcus]MCI0129706.1 hypothetical protein [Vagococcus sp. CY53-2]UNM90351.1 hypothetical protein MN187_04495 [Vagococcus sp. CY52-2]